MTLDLSQLPLPAIIGLALVAVVQVTLAVIALVLIARTPRERLVFAAKWPWVLIVLLVNFIGPILFFAIGRKPSSVESTSVASESTVAQTVADLYGGDRP